MTATSMCAVHPAVPSITTCRRCGRFCCADCLPKLETCTQCVARELSELPSVAGRAKFATIMLFVTAGFHGLMALTGVVEVIDGTYSEEGVAAMLSGCVALLYLVAFVVTIVAFLRWFHLAARRALSRNVPLEVQTPAAAVLSWFIPFINLVRPFNLSRQMLTSEGKDTGGVGSWQALWVAGNIFANLSARVPKAGGSIAGIAADVMLIGAAVMAVRVIRELSPEEPEVRTLTP